MAVRETRQQDDVEAGKRTRGSNTDNVCSHKQRIKQQDSSKQVGFGSWGKAKDRNNIVAGKPVVMSESQREGQASARISEEKKRKNLDNSRGQWEQEKEEEH